MNKQMMNIWGRNHEIEIKYEIFDDEPITNNQIMTADNLNSADFAGAKKAVIDYVEEELAEVNTPAKVDNIFRYVIPKKIFIAHSDENRVFALLCNYRLDMEHGLAVVFENEKCKEVGPQDIIL